MEKTIGLLLIVGQVGLVGTIFIFLPRISRRGLLFGVYVGEEESKGQRAREIVRRWTGAVLAAMVLSLFIGLYLLESSSPATAVTAVIAMLLIGFFFLYFKAHADAKGLAVKVVPPCPPTTTAKPAAAVLPLLTLVVTLGVGAYVFSYGATHYHRLPEQVPIHFGGSGEPDAWAPRSFSSVMLLPVTTLFMGPFMALIAYLIANAPQAIRIGDGGASIVAQERFRGVTSTFLSGVSLLVTGMLALLSYGAIQIGLGQAHRLPTAFLFFAVAMGVYVLVGVVVILIKYSRTPNQRLATNQSGQASGGARLEAAGADASLTDGLADNRNWKYGLFYVNRDDPSIFVEKRFGLGYTINFGNWKAVLGLAVFLAGIAAILIMSLFAIG